MDSTQSNECAAGWLCQGTSAEWMLLGCGLPVVVRPEFCVARCFQLVLEQSQTTPITWSLPLPRLWDMWEYSSVLLNCLWARQWGGVSCSLVPSSSVVYNFWGFHSYPTARVCIGDSISVQVPVSWLATCVCTAVQGLASRLTIHSQRHSFLLSISNQPVHHTGPCPKIPKPKNKESHL